MNACVLLVSGVQFAVDDFVANSKLTSNPSRYSLWRSGEPLRNGSHEDSGFILDVCAVESKGLKELIERVISFLKDNFTELKQLMDHPDVETGVLDFSINRRDVTTQYDRFPAELIRLAGNLGLWIDLTQFAGARN
jgi:hypothetical protein